MSGPQDRRGFLRGLATLPLIGGSSALIGNPIRADVAPTRDILKRYIAWLANEHAAALIEYERPEVDLLDDTSWAHWRVRAPLFWFPEIGNLERTVRDGRPSLRAALVLSAVGCDRSGGL